MSAESIGTNVSKNTSPIGIVGTGDFAAALTKSLSLAGYDVIIGSRYPDQRQHMDKLVQDVTRTVFVTSVERCCQEAQVIFMAIHSQHFK